MWPWTAGRRVGHCASAVIRTGLGTRRATSCRCVRLQIGSILTSVVTWKWSASSSSASGSVAMAVLSQRWWGLWTSGVCRSSSGSVILKVSLSAGGWFSVAGSIVTSTSSRHFSLATRRCSSCALNWRRRLRSLTTPLRTTDVHKLVNAMCQTLVVRRTLVRGVPSLNSCRLYECAARVLPVSAHDTSADTCRVSLALRGRRARARDAQVLAANTHSSKRWRWSSDCVCIESTSFQGLRDKHYWETHERNELSCAAPPRHMR